MVLNFLHGGAAINVLARQAGACDYVDIGVAVEFERCPLIRGKVMCGARNSAQGPR
jgi:nicotinate-nucleotide--dimethylbenzimidazole phosphoribosyltransferase